ncbi:MAG: TfoX/Sxy family protein [Ilumatobacteraceae bacterium]
MAFDDDLGRRIARIIDRIDDLGMVEERRMFGGLTFLVDGHIVIGASGSGGIMARVDPDDVEELLTSTPARPATMGPLDARMAPGRQHSGHIRRRARRVGATGHCRCVIAAAEGRSELNAGGRRRGPPSS